MCLVVAGCSGNLSSFAAVIAAGAGRRVSACSGGPAVGLHQQRRRHAADVCGDRGASLRHPGPADHAAAAGTIVAAAELSVPRTAVGLLAAASGPQGADGMRCIRRDDVSCRRFLMPACCLCWA